MALKFKRVSLSTNMEPLVFYSVSGLPAGESCNVIPEDGTRPLGEWYVSAKRDGKKKVIRCKSLDEAKAAATKWATTGTAKR